MLAESKSVSAEYVKFCSEEELLANLDDEEDELFWGEHEKEEKEFHVQCLAAFHGHLPLLQELLADKERLSPRIAEYAGESSFSQRLVCFGF